VAVHGRVHERRSVFFVAASGSRLDRARRGTRPHRREKRRPPIRRRGSRRLASPLQVHPGTAKVKKLAAPCALLRSRLAGEGGPLSLASPRLARAEGSLAQHYRQENLRHQERARLKGMRPIVARIGELEPELRKRATTSCAPRPAEFRQRLSNGESLDSLIPEPSPCAARPGAAREHAPLRRAAHRRMVLHRGCIAEMKTGEGKTPSLRCPST